MICTMVGDVWHVEGLDATLRTSDGGGMPPGCTRRSGWSSPRGRSMSWAATRSPGCTTSTATARPTIYECVQQRLRDLARRPRLHLRPPARRLGPLLHRLGQAGAAADLGRRPTGRGRGDRVPQPRRPGPRPGRHDHGPLLRGRMDARVDGLRDQARRPLRLPRAARRPAARPAAGLSPARAGQFQRRPGHRRPTTGSGRSRGQMLHFSFGTGHVFPAAPREGRRPAAGRGRADARRVPLGRRTGAASTPATASSTSPG